MPEVVDGGGRELGDVDREPHEVPLGLMDPEVVISTREVHCDEPSERRL